jgi:nitric oxide reductase large subunit
MDALGTFILWDAMTDIAFQNNHMDQSGYYVGNAPKEPDFVQPETKSFPWGTFVIGTLMIVGIGIAGFFFVSGFRKQF